MFWVAFLPSPSSVWYCGSAGAWLGQGQPFPSLLPIQMVTKKQGILKLLWKYETVFCIISEFQIQSWDLQIQPHKKTNSDPVRYKTVQSLFLFSLLDLLRLPKYIVELLLFYILRKQRLKKLQWLWIIYAFSIRVFRLDPTKIMDPIMVHLSTWTFRDIIQCF